MSDIHGKVQAVIDARAQLARASLDLTEAVLDVCGDRRMLVALDNLGSSNGVVAMYVLGVFGTAKACGILDAAAILQDPSAAEELPRIKACGERMQELLTAQTGRKS